MARTLCDYMPFLQKFGKGALERHISHQFSVEMSKKSEIVSLQLDIVSVIYQPAQHKDSTWDRTEVGAEVRRANSCSLPSATVRPN